MQIYVSWQALAMWHNDLCVIQDSRPKKIVRFRFPTDPDQLHTTQKGVERYKEKFHQNISFLVILPFLYRLLYLECTFVIPQSS